MSEVPKNQRTDIYPYNIDKANLLAKSLNMTVTEMVNYLIDTADIQQLTKISFTDKKTLKKISFTRSTENYDPKKW